MALGALGCVDLRYAAEDASAADVPVPIDAVDASDASDVFDAPDAADARDATDVTDVADAMDARDVADVTDATDAPDVMDAADVRDVADVMDAPDAADVRDVVDAADARDAMDAPFVVDALFLDSPTARDSSDVPRDVAPIWGMQLLINPTATFSQAMGYGVSRAINGQLTEGQGWGIAPGGSMPADNQTAAFEFEATTPASGTGTRVVVTLINNSVGYRLACFRLWLTSSSRDTFADGLETLGHPTGTANWITPTIVSVTATNGVMIAPVGPMILTDEMFVASTYTVTLDTSASQLTGIRLDVLRNGALVTGGPGTDMSVNSRGNFSLTEIQVTVSPR